MIGVDHSSRVNRRRVTALSVASPARAWLRHTTGARVLHVFDRACNLVNAAGEIVSLVSPELREGPFAIVVPLEVPFSYFIGVDSHVAVQDTTLDVGGLWIDASTAREWNPRPRWEDARQALSLDLWNLATTVSGDWSAGFSLRSAHMWQPEEPALSLPKDCTPGLCQTPVDLKDRLLEWLCARAPSDSLAHTLFESPGSRCTGVQSSVIESARQPLATLQAGIARGDPALCRSGAHSLAGLGFGLTPAGDDFLLGAMVAIWSAFPSDAAAALAGSIAAASAPLTTRLSAAWLQAAARGEVAAPWHDLLAGVTARSRERVLSAAERILDMGHTSGADALAGLAAGLIAVGQTTTAPLNFDL